MRRFITLIAGSLLLVSCAAPIQNLTKTQYFNPDFSAEKLNAGGLALLPITAGQGQEGYRRPLGDELNQNLASAVPKGKTIGWQNSMELINRASKVTDYEDLITGYRQTSILNRDKVKELYTALGVNYAMYVSLQDFSETSHTSYNVFSGMNTTKTANVSAQCLVIDLVTGDIMLEIIGQAKSDASGLSYNREYEEYAGVMAQSILSQLPGSSVRRQDKTIY